MPRIPGRRPRGLRPVYAAFVGPVFGLARRIVRDPAQAEVAQEVLVQVWRTASRFDPQRGSAQAWVMTIAHRRAVDRVRGEQAAEDREARLASTSAVVDSGEVAEAVHNRLGAAVGAPLPGRFD